MAFWASTLMATTISTRSEPLTETIQGVSVADPYRWLENGDSDEVRSWTAQQNRLLRQTLDAVPSRRRLVERLWALHGIGALEAPVCKGKGKVARYFYTRREGQQNQPVLYLRQGLAGADRVLLDVNALVADGTQALDWWYPSEDGRLLAFGVSAGGSELSTLRVRDVDTGQDRPDVIPWTRACSLAWLPSGRGFYYTRYPAPGSVPAGQEQYQRHVFFHRLGTVASQDRLIFGEGLGPSAWTSVLLSPDGRWLGLEVSDGAAKTELFLIDTNKRGAPSPIPVVTGRPALFNLVEVLDDRLYVVSNENAPHYCLFQIDPRKPLRENWKLIIAEGQDTLEWVAAVGGKLAALYLKDASSRVRVFSRAGKLEREIKLPGLGTVTGLHGRHQARELFFGFTSFLTPTAVVRHDLGTGRSAVWQKLASPIDEGAFSVEQVRYPSKDGTLIPMFLVARKSLVRDGRAPALLYGYGGFNLNITPAFAAAVAPFIEQGGVYAVANLRGGGEYGETWHRAGMLGHKQNVFDDFIAAAEFLIREKIASRDRLAISGRSNGGLLVAAAIAQKPDLFRAAICGVPITDMVRYHLFRIARLWIPEYGTAEDPEQFKFLYAYSPYHHVKDGVAYPATLIFTAASDTRVDPLHARKFAARLQAATRGPGPILLRLESQAGHGVGKPLAKSIEQYADEMAFLCGQLGMDAL
ncbi:MAG TPA: prolyl oligopeptidase family serine peptidase [Polyangia bacterium]|nr:prolyl oligopeptidase family serine peptidase [Polyangia bacterium]